MALGRPFELVSTAVVLLRHANRSGIQTFHIPNKRVSWPGVGGPGPHSASQSDTPVVHKSNNLAHREGGFPVPSVRCLRLPEVDVTVADPTDAGADMTHGVARRNYMTRISALIPKETSSYWSATHCWTTWSRWKPGPGYATCHQKQKTGGCYPAKAAYCFHSSLHVGGPSFCGQTARNLGPLMDGSHSLCKVDSWW